MKKTFQKHASSDNQQKTLFQCWNSSNNLNQNTNVASSNSNKTNTIPKTFPNQSKSSSTSAIQKPTNQASNNDDIITIEEDELISMGLVDDENKENADNDEDKDLELFFASESYMNNNNTTMTNSRLSMGAANSLAEDFVDEDKLEKLTVGIDDQAILSTQYYDTTGCDLSAVNEWFYPNNMPTRAYQYSIIEQCLHKNTMVVLPTGLGKTFVAAVVMLNFYRWYPNGKIIFMAPTKPLVNQQSDACYKIVGILKEDMVQMTGQMQPDKRKALWDTKRVFFLTPQVISNDILRGIVDVNLIKLVVIDEAHKALGEYAFCKVIESIVEVNKNFRIVALTATPGSDIKAVQNVIDKLLISNIELRSDESIDIQQYNHGREVNKFVLPLTNEVLKIKNAFVNVMRMPLKRLEMNRVFTIKDPNALSKIFILQNRESFRKSASYSTDKKRASFVECDLALLITMIHALELLTQYGVKSFYIFLKSFVENLDGSKSNAQSTKLKNEIMNNIEMAPLYEKFKQTFDDKNAVIPRDMRHPKLLKLEEVILDHFKKFGKNDTRVMIFSQYRESVFEICQMLEVHPEIKPMEFVGQSTTQGTRKSVTQKEQLEVVKKFREGGYNTLVSTCVGEEGLDIGEVDLIICYDSQKSPIRLIQRMGRTGRKREGHIVVLLTEGKEENSYKTSLTRKKNIYKIIQNGQKNFKFYQNNPLMIPKGTKPKCHKVFITIPEEKPPEEKKPKGKKEKEPKSTENKAGKKKKTNAKDKKKSDKSSDVSDTELPDFDFDLKTYEPKTSMMDDPGIVNETNLNLDASLKKNKAKKTSKVESTDKQTLSSSSSTTQLKLLNNCNFLNLNKKPTSSVNIGSLMVPEPPNVKKLIKTLGKKNEDLAEINIKDCIRLWETDEDDFLTFGNKEDANSSDTISKNKNNLNESIVLKEKFSLFYSELLGNLTLNDASDDREMIVDDTLSSNNNSKNSTSNVNTSNPKNSFNEKPPEPIQQKKEANFQVFDTNLNDLFSDDENDANKMNVEPEETNKVTKEPEFNTDFIVTETVEPGFNDNYNDCISYSPIVVQTQKASIINNFNQDQENLVKKTDLLDKFKEKNQYESPVVISKNSTSTPRSILKNKTNKMIEDNSISYSPLVVRSQAANKNINFNLETKIDETSPKYSAGTQIGISQALRILNTTTPTLATPKTRTNNQEICFDMKSNLIDLFGDENMTMDIIELDDRSLPNYDYNNSVNLSGSRSRKLRFDDESIKEVYEVEPKKKAEKSVTFSDDPSAEDSFFIPKKKTKANQNLSSSEDEAKKKLHETVDMDDDYNEAIGNNQIEHSDESFEDDYEQYDEAEYDNFKSKKSKRRNNFVLDEADDDDDDEDETSEEDGDVRDSFVVSSDDVTPNESAMYGVYQKSIKNREHNNHYLNRPLRPVTDDLFSQMPTQDTSYAMDSFVVADDHVSIYKKKKKKKAKNPKVKERKENQENLDRIKRFNENTKNIVIPLNDNRTRACASSNLNDDSSEPEDDSIRIPRNKTRKNQILDSFVEEPVVKTRKNVIKSDSDDAIILIDEPKKKPKPPLVKQSNFNESNEIIEIKEEPKKATNNNSNKAPVEIKLDETDDEEFNQWLVNNSFTEKPKPKEAEPEKATSTIKPHTSKEESAQTSAYFKPGSSIASNIDIKLNHSKIEAQPNNIASLKLEQSKTTATTTKNNTTLSSSAISNMSTIDLPKNSNWLIIDNSLLVSAADIIKNIKRVWDNDKVVIQSSLHCDFIISQRCAVIKLKWSDLNQVSNRDHLIDKYAKARSIYPQVIIMLQDDRDATNANKGRSKLFDSILGYLTRVSSIMISKYKTEELTNQLNSLSKNETSLGFSLDIDCNRILENKKKEISFYLSLPNISLINAMYFSKNYDTLNKFCNSSLEDLKSKGKMNDRNARKLLKFLIDSS